MGYSNILVAIDLSEESREVLETARLIANRNDARLQLATVIKPLTQVYGGLDMAPIATGTVSFEEEAFEQARAQLAVLSKDYGVAESDVHVLLGSPTQQIGDLAEASDVDLIVIGSHGRHGLGLLLGSTANAVLHGAQCDVLAVRLQFAQ